MKSLILAIVLVFTTTANAETIAQLNKGIRSGDTYKVINAYVDSDGTLDVALTDMFAAQEISEVVQTKIHSRNLTKIENMVIRLANAEIIEKMFGIVCKIAVSPEQMTNHLLVLRDYDYEQGGRFLGPMTTVHGPQGCWVSHKIGLKEDYQNATALQLKQIIEVLAVEALGNSLK